MGKALYDYLPPVDQTIHWIIAGHFGRHSVEKEVIGWKGKKETA